MTSDVRTYLARAVSAIYVDHLDPALGIRMIVEFTTKGTDVTDYSIVLVVERDRRAQTIRVYDRTHWHNEVHRYALSSGKQPGKPFHSGTLGEGMRAAIEAIKGGYREMTEGWERQ